MQKILNIISVVSFLLVAAITGGGVFGYQCVWVNRNNRVFDELGFHPKNTIKNLTELNNLV